MSVRLFKAIQLVSIIPDFLFLSTRRMVYSMYIMIMYLKTHEKTIANLLQETESKTDWKTISKIHERKLQYFQQERLIHLFVMLTTSLAALLSFFFTIMLDIPAFFILTSVLVILSIAYVIHYFRLENGVQRLYRLGDKIEEKQQ